jgi:hypothetical protein
MGKETKKSRDKNVYFILKKISSNVAYIINWQEHEATGKSALGL